MNMELTTARWKYGKTWVYSATYDEALSELHRFVIPHHLDLGIPGHVEVVAGAIGKVRAIGASSYNGFHHMSGAELRELLTLGWGVGCHSWSHQNVADDPQKELLLAREAIEDAIRHAVTIYTAPGDNHNMAPVILEKAREYGYLAAMGITDDLNLAEPDTEHLFVLNRPALHERMSETYNRAFDPYNRIMQAKACGAWIVDYLHCPLEKAAHDYKDCTQAHHLERLRAIAELGHGDCWFANPDDVVDYRLLRRCIRLSQQEDDNTWKVDISGLPERVQKHEMTFELHTFLPPEAIHITYDNIPIIPEISHPKTLIFTIPVCDGSFIRVKTPATTL